MACALPTVALPEAEEIAQLACAPPEVPHLVTIVEANGFERPRASVLGDERLLVSWERGSDPRVIAIDVTGEPRRFATDLPPARVLATARGIGWLAADSGGLETWDLRDPERAVRLATLYPTGGEIEALGAGGDRLVMIRREGAVRRIHLLDTSDPAHPRELTVAEPLHLAQTIHDVKLVGALAYLDVKGAPIEVLDLDAQAAATPIVTHGPAFVDGTIAYAPRGEQILTLDLTLGAEPLGALGLAPERWAVGGGTLVAASGDRLFVADVRDPHAPRLVGEIDGRPFERLHVLPDGRRLAAVERGRVRFYDLGATPGIIAQRADADAEILAVAAGSGRAVFQMADAIGMAELDPWTPLGPRLEDPHPGTELALAGDRVIAQRGPRIVIWSDAGETRHIFDADATGLAALPDGVVTAGSTVDVFDLAGRRMASLGPAHAHLGIAIADDRAYLHDGDGISVVDLADPADPRLLGWTGGLGALVGRPEILGETLYARTAEGVQIVDVSDPALARTRGFLSTGSPPTDLRAVAPGVLLVGLGEYGVGWVDVRAPDHPVLLRRFGLPGQSIAVSGGTIVAAGGRKWMTLRPCP